VEQRYPILFEEYSLAEGSGGAGTHRGGFGINYKVRIARGQARASFVMDHGRTGPNGAQGGEEGGRNSVRIRYRDGRVYDPPHLSKDQDIRISEGDSVEVTTPGGGGYGSPMQRDPEDVAHDVQRGYYTSAEAERRFAVALTSAGAVDETGTAALRAAK
jgi:N-methylhydantoinase B